MDQLEAMRTRHAVRQYLDKPIEHEVRSKLQEVVDEANAEGNLHMQLLFDEPECFDAAIAHYGKFSGVTNYLAIVGKNSPGLDKRAGYYGEKVVLTAQTLGLNSCWVALSHGKTKAEFGPDERLVIVVALGYGATQGVPHASKPIEQVSDADERPEWFQRGVEAALLAPTAVNQQKFRFVLKDGKVTAHAGIGPCSKIDLGIAVYHFELASGHKIW